jgi:hypothetical protein
VSSFELHLAAENKAAGTIRIYTEAPRCSAAAHLLPETDKTRWEQVDTQDVQRWIVWLLRHYSETYACQQYRSLQQFFLWLAEEDENSCSAPDISSPTPCCPSPSPLDRSVTLLAPLPIAHANRNQPGA